MMGETSRFCFVWVTLMALPPLAGALWALRGGASTRPTLSGALAGLLAGGAGAALYAIHCTEDSPLFYAVWYGLAILARDGDRGGPRPSPAALVGRACLRRGSGRFARPPIRRTDTPHDHAKSPPSSSSASPRSINAERADAGLPALKVEVHLNAAAQDHSDWMAETGHFSHTGEGGSSATERIEEAGFPLEGDWQTAENIAWAASRATSTPARSTRCTRG